MVSFLFKFFGDTYYLK